MEENKVFDLFEYIDYTGQKTFEEEPFNNVDSLVISQLSYMKLDHHVPWEAEKSDGISLEEILNTDNIELLYRDERNYDANKMFFEKLAKSKRYKDLRLRDFVEVLSVQAEVQFCAMTAVYAPLDFYYVVYRGTDEHVVGWKEDFNMMYKTPVPAHKMALKYLMTVSERITCDFYIGGHSKGGNLAVFASAEAEPNIQDRIIRVFSHDGPGFKHEFISRPEYDRIKQKIVKQVPESSIFGVMLFTTENFDIIISKDRGIEQHNPYNWLSDGTDFIHADKLDKVYLLMQKVFNTWSMELTDDQARLYGDTLFDLIEKTGVNDMNDLSSSNSMVHFASAIHDAYKQLDDEIRNQFDGVIDLYMSIASELIKEQTKRDAKKGAAKVKNAVLSIEKELEEKTEALSERIEKKSKRD